MLNFKEIFNKFTEFSFENFKDLTFFLNGFENLEEEKEILIKFMKNITNYTEKQIKNVSTDISEVISKKFFSI